MDPSPDAVLSFVETTGADPDVAQRYLQVCDGDVQTAVQLYFENGGSDLIGTEGPPAAGTGSTSPTRSSAAHTSSGGHSFDYGFTAGQDDDDDISAVVRDHVTAATQQSAGTTRAPIAPHRETLVSDYDMNVNLPGHIRFGGETVSTSRPNNPFNQNVGDLLTGATDPLAGGWASRIPTQVPDEEYVSPEVESKESKLAALFRPPIDVMFRGTFDNAKAHARTGKKWLLIDLQDPSEFQCQMLNRDLWSDKRVKEFIKANFIFLQPRVTDADGQQYKSFYPVTEFPHIALIDPRTGAEFLSEHSLFKTAATQPPVKLPPPKKTYAEMSEEEQIQAAIQASMDAIGGDTSIVIDDAPAQSSPPPTSKGKEKASSVPQTPQEGEQAPYVTCNDDITDADAQVVDQIQAIEHPEPPQGPDTTRIQLRLPGRASHPLVIVASISDRAVDGARVVRRFRKDDPVRAIFEFVKATVPDAQKTPFELVFHRDSLVEKLNQTLDAAGLANVSLQMSFL
ncbi:UBX domain protein Ubx2 [Sorochytrium milnesiophthora]